jgi:RimJ/RimL family protein N-acetyltransferase
VRDEEVILRDGGAILVRSVEPADADGLVSLHARFSERTRYFRYFSSYPRIPARDLERFANVDHVDREAMIALDGTKVIAVGRYERLGPGADAAEVAFAVEDDSQRRGIAPVLLERLAAAAREAGLRRFVAEVLPANQPMMKVFAHAGFEIESEYADGVVHVQMEI